MMRIVRQPQTPQGQARARVSLAAARGAVCCLMLMSLFTFVAGTAFAQSTNPNPAAAVNPFSLNLIAPVDPRTGRAMSSFPTPQGGVLGGPTRKPDKAQPLLLEGDELIYDTKRNKVVARGNVQIYFDDYILTGDQITYDQNANTLTAGQQF